MAVFWNVALCSLVDTDHFTASIITLVTEAFVYQTTSQTTTIDIHIRLFEISDVPRVADMLMLFL
jgi:hypothetical protein